MKLTTTPWSSLVSWKLDTCFISEEEAYKKHNSEGQYIKRCCLAAGDHTLICRDSGGDGWNGGFMEIQGHIYCNDFIGYKAMRRITVSGIDEQFWVVNDSYITICLLLFIVK